MALVSRELAIIMLVTAALGVIGVFPLISSALMAAQALLWLQQAAGSSHSHDTIYCIAIATIVFALIQIIV
jgi:accessory gene regulator protein AgrB